MSEPILRLRGQIERDFPSAHLILSDCADWEEVLIWDVAVALMRCRGSNLYRTLVVEPTDETSAGGYWVFIDPPLPPEKERPRGRELPLALRVAIARLYEWCEDRHDQPWARLTIKMEFCDISCAECWEYWLE
jgi:hypothetical protein